MQHVDLLPVVVERENAVLPDGFDAWGVKSVRPDLKTHGGYQWPTPGGVAECDAGRIIHDNRTGCPKQSGDGLCVADTWRGMASGGIPAKTLLLVAYCKDEVLGSELNGSKLRLPRVAVVAIVDGERLLREAGHGANLRIADLRGADLRGANLWEANLWEADLKGANLWGANLRGANLREANLREADLRGANLRGADLRGANLRGANLRGADLREADLRGANLRGADLRGATLREADLRGATLRGAYLEGAQLSAIVDLRENQPETIGPTITLTKGEHKA